MAAEETALGCGWGFVSNLIALLTFWSPEYSETSFEATQASNPSPVN